LLGSGAEYIQTIASVHFPPLFYPAFFRPLSLPLYPQRGHALDNTALRRVDPDFPCSLRLSGRIAGGIFGVAAGQYPSVSP